MIFVNCMEKLSMNNLEMLQARMVGAMNAGVDGIMPSAGLIALWLWSVITSI